MSVETLRPRAGRALLGSFIGLALISGALLADPTGDIATYIPEASAVVLMIPTVQEAMGNLVAFQSACGAPTEGQTPDQIIADMAKLQGQDPATAGINTGGTVLGFLDASFQELGAIFELSDPDAFAQTLVANGLEQRGVEDNVFYVKTTAMPDGSSTVTEAVAIRGDRALIADSDVKLQAMLTSHTPPALASDFVMPEGGGIKVLIDAGSIIAAHRPMIDQLLHMITAVAAMHQTGGSPTGLAKLLAVYPVMINGALDAVAQTRFIALTITPTAEALYVAGEARYPAGSSVLVSLPRHIDKDLTLDESMPSDPICAVVSTFDAERMGSLAARMTAVMRTAAASPSPESQAAWDALEQCARQFYSELGDEIAFAYYPGEADAILPAMAMVARSPDPAASMQQMTALMTRPEILTVMNDMYGTTAGQISIEDLGTMDVGGQQARHIRLNGLGALAQQFAGANVSQPLSPEIAMMMSMNELDYWFATKDDLIIITVESQPTRMGQILRGEAEVTGPPPIAGQIELGADAVWHLSLGRVFAYVGNLVPPTAPGNPAEMFNTVAQNLRGTEQGIWGSLRFFADGLEGTLVVPSGDIGTIVQTIKSMQPPPPGM